MDLLTTDQAAIRLGLSPGTLENWRVVGRGPQHVRLSPRCVRYRPTDLDDWAAARVVSSTSEQVAT